MSYVTIAFLTQPQTVYPAFLYWRQSKPMWSHSGICAHSLSSLETDTNVTQSVFFLRVSEDESACISTRKTQRLFSSSDTLTCPIHILQNRPSSVLSEPAGWDSPEQLSTQHTLSLMIQKIHRALQNIVPKTNYFRFPSVRFTSVQLFLARHFFYCIEDHRWDLFNSSVISLRHQRD